MILATMMIERASKWNKELIHHTEDERELIRRFICQLDELLEKDINDRRQFVRGAKAINAFQVVERMEEENKQIIKMDVDHNTVPHVDRDEWEQF